jgi:hypothetical protein
MLVIFIIIRGEKIVFNLSSNEIGEILHHMSLMIIREFVSSLRFTESSRVYPNISVRDRPFCRGHYYL